MCSALTVKEARIYKEMESLREEVVANSDLLDAAMIFGTGFAPFKGGPVEYAKTAGPMLLRDRLNVLQAKYGERFKASPGWSEI